MATCSSPRYFQATANIRQGDAAIIPGYHGAEAAYVVMQSADTPSEDDTVQTVAVPPGGPHVHGDGATRSTGALSIAIVQGKRDSLSRSIPQTALEVLQLNTVTQTSGDVDAEAEDHCIDPALLQAKTLLEVTMGGSVTIDATTRSLVVQIPVHMQHQAEDTGPAQIKSKSPQIELSCGGEPPERKSVHGPESTGVLKVIASELVLIFHCPQDDYNAAHARLVNSVAMM